MLFIQTDLLVLADQHKLALAGDWIGGTSHHPTGSGNGREVQELATAHQSGVHGLHSRTSFWLWDCNAILLHDFIACFYSSMYSTFIQCVIDAGRNKGSS